MCTQRIIGKDDAKKRCFEIRSRVHYQYTSQCEQTNDSESDMELCNDVCAHGTRHRFLIKLQAEATKSFCVTRFCSPQQATQYINDRATDVRVINLYDRWANDILQLYICL
jgi:hypothetical protein